MWKTRTYTSLCTNTIIPSPRQQANILDDANSTVVCRLGSGCLKAFLFRQATTTERVDAIPELSLRQEERPAVPLGWFLVFLC